MKIYKKAYNITLDNINSYNFRLTPTGAIMYIQDAFSRLAAIKKMAAFNMFRENLYWVVGEINMDFINSLPFWSEEITVEIWFSELEKSKIFTDFKVFSHNKNIITGNICWFLVNPKTKRSVEVEMIKDRFEIQNTKKHPKFNLPNKSDVLKEITHKNNFYDVDFNGHTNNRSYINIINSAFDDDFKQKYRLKQLNIRFDKETHLNDILKCTTYKTSRELEFVNIITKDNVEVCKSTFAFSREDTDNILEYELNIT